MKKLFILIWIILLTCSIKLAAQPSNNNCASAIALIEGTNCAIGNNTLATIEPFETLPPANQQCWASVPNNTVWYTFTPSITGTYTTTTDNRLPNATTPDTQLKLFSGSCGSFTLVACSEDNGEVNTLAGQLTTTLNAGVTYYIQVDVFGATQASFCISIFSNVVPVNDCINNAIDLTTLINSVSPTNPYECNSGFIYNAPGGVVSDDPVRQDVSGDPNGCNGYDPLLPLTTNPDHRDIWFTFTKSSVTPESFLQLFPANTYPVLWAMGLYSGTATSTCPAGNISGLTYIDCSCGVLIDIPPGNEKGGVRDVSLCSTPVHPRLNLGNLPNGQYYIRVWDFAGSTPSEGIFNLCVESTAPRLFSSDICSTPNVGYVGTLFNQGVNIAYTGLSNAGALGNSCNTAPNEPLLGATPAGQARIGCAGPWISYVGAINNVMNITMIHSFSINACPGCAPTAIIKLDNIVMEGTIGNVAQLQVMQPGNCTGSTQTIMNGTTSSSCIEMRVAANAPLPNGQYYIVVDGQDGQLLTYDLSLTINYPCSPTGSCTPLPIELLTFKGEHVNKMNKLEWITASEINNAYFNVERSVDGINFTFLKKIIGAGNTTSLNYYTTYDENAPGGLSYYRLKQVDFNGDQSYSPVINIKNTSEPFFPLLIYKDSNDNLIINYNSLSTQEVLLKINDMAGKTVMKYNAAVMEGFSQIKIPEENLKQGVYLVELHESNGKIQLGKILK